MDLFNQLQNQRISETQNYFSQQKEIASETLSLLLLIQNEIDEQIVYHKNFIKNLNKVTAKLVNNLKKTEENFLESFKKTENIKNKQTSECMDQLSKTMTATLNYGKKIDEKLLFNNFEIANFLSNVTNILKNQSSSEISMKRDSTLFSLSNCVEKIKIKDSMEEFTPNSSFSMKFLFELFFDFIPQDHETFVNLRMTSKEVASVVFDKWTFITNAISWRSYFNCKNISKASFKFEKNSQSIRDLPNFFSSFNIKDCTFYMPHYDPIMANVLSNMMLNQKTVESLTLISFKTIHPKIFEKLMKSGIKTLKFVNSYVLPTNMFESIFVKDSIDSEITENLIIVGCPNFLKRTFGEFQLKKVYSDYSLNMKPPFQFHCVNGKVFSSVESLKDFANELLIIREDFKNVVGDINHGYYQEDDDNEELILMKMNSYIDFLLKNANEQKSIKKKKI
jgi:hypothetical protein